MKQMFLIMFIVSLLTHFAMAEERRDEGKIAQVNIEVGKVTEIVFTEKVGKIVKGGPSESILVEVIENSVYVLPKTDHPPDIFVTTVSGSSYPIQFHLAAEHDIKVQVGIPSRHSSSTQGFYTDVMDLMRDLLLEKEPAGATALPAGGQSLIANHQIQVKVEKVYELVDWKAYVLTARNVTKNAVIVPIEQVSLPHLLAISSDRDMLSAKGEEGDSAKVYVIVGK